MNRSRGDDQVQNDNQVNEEVYIEIVKNTNFEDKYALEQHLRGQLLLFAKTRAILKKKVSGLEQTKGKQIQNQIIKYFIEGLEKIEQKDEQDNQKTAYSLKVLINLCSISKQNANGKVQVNYFTEGLLNSLEKYNILSQILPTDNKYVKTIKDKKKSKIFKINFYFKAQYQKQIKETYFYIQKINQFLLQVFNVQKQFIVRKKNKIFFFESLSTFKYKQIYFLWIYKYKLVQYITLIRNLIIEILIELTLERNDINNDINDEEFEKMNDLKFKKKENNNEVELQEKFRKWKIEFINKRKKKNLIIPQHFTISDMLQIQKEDNNNQRDVVQNQPYMMPTHQNIYKLQNCKINLKQIFEFNKNLHENIQIRLFISFNLIKKEQQLIVNEYNYYKGNSNNHSRQCSSIPELYKEEEELTLNDKRSNIFFLFNQYQQKINKGQLNQYSPSKTHLLENQFIKLAKVDEDYEKERTLQNLSSRQRTESYNQSYMNTSQDREQNDDKETQLNSSYFSQQSQTPQIDNQLQQFAISNQNFQPTQSNQIEILNPNSISPRTYKQIQNSKINNIQQSINNQATYKIADSKQLNNNERVNQNQKQSNNAHKIQGSQQNAFLNVNSPRQASNQQFNQSQKYPQQQQQQNNIVSPIKLNQEVKINEIYKIENITSYSLLGSPQQTAINKYLNSTQNQSNEHNNGFSLNSQQDNTKDAVNESLQTKKDDLIIKQRILLLNQLSQLYLNDKKKCKFLAEQYRILKTEHYELILKWSLPKSKQVNMNQLSFTFTIKNKTLSDIKDVSISLTNQQTSNLTKQQIYIKIIQHNYIDIEIEFDRSQIVVPARKEETIKMIFKTNQYPIQPIDCVFQIGINVPIKHFQVYTSILKYIQVNHNTSDLVSWKPKFKSISLREQNINLNTNKSSLREFYLNSLRQDSSSQNQRIGYFSFTLPILADLKNNQDNVLRFILSFTNENQNLKISMSDFFNDYSHDLSQQNLSIIQDQILYSLAYTFGSEQAFKHIFNSESQNVIKQF